MRRGMFVRLESVQVTYQSNRGLTGGDCSSRDSPAGACASAAGSTQDYAGADFAATLRRKTYS